MLLGYALSLFFCVAYTNYLCTETSNSGIHRTLEAYCGRCTSSFPTKFVWTTEQRPDYSSLSKTLSTMNQHLIKIQENHDSLSSSVSKISNRVSEVELAVAKLKYDQPAFAMSSPMLRAVNYASPGTGAVIDPYYTSPTKHKEFTLLQKLLLRGALDRYKSRHPSEVLRRWDEVGECWCSAPTTGHAQVAILMGQQIYPVEVVIEHVPNEASPTPGSAPQGIEVWADLANADPAYLAVLEPEDFPTDPGLPSTFRRVGKFIYDGKPFAPKHVQHFPLQFNQWYRTYPSQKIIVRAVSNWGANYTCFYRVRIHGLPMVPVAPVEIKPFGGHMTNAADLID